MKGSFVKENGNVAFKTVEEEDIEFLRDTQMLEGVEEEMGFRYPPNMEEVKEGFEERSEKDSFIEFLVVYKGEKAGQVGASFELENGKAGFGLYINPEFQGQGVGRKTAEMMLEFLFRNLPVERVDACYLSGNEKSRRMQEKIGFEKQAVRRQQIFQRGRYRDIVETCYFREGWEKQF